MANTDVTITLAGQFQNNVLSTRQQKLIEITGKAMNVLTTGAKPTVAQWNTFLNTAIALFPPQCKRDMGAQRAAIYWQLAVGNLNGNVAVAGRSNSQILDASSPIQALDDLSLDALNTYLEGRLFALGILTTVYT